MHDTTMHDAQTSSDPPFFYVFVANALALDLINTDVVLRRKRRDLLVSVEAAASWWEQAHSHYPQLELPAATMREQLPGEALLERMKQLRATLRTVFAAVTAGRPLSSDEIEPLNAILRLGYQRLVVSPEGKTLPSYGVHQEGVEMLLLPIALSAYQLLTQAEQGRLRACGNPYCIALFYDISRSATRRWCSEGCMNRARSAERYAQKKSQAVTLSRPSPDRWYPAACPSAESSRGRS